MTLDYAVVVTPLSSEDGGGYLAEVPALPGCMSDGESPEEAIRNVEDAILSWIEEAEQLGRTIPKPCLSREPSDAPFTLSAGSVQTRLPMTDAGV